jgi:putative tricarboxylic transport membrane protein
VLGLEKSEAKIGEIDYRKLWEYNLGQALLLLGLMALYALLLRPAGFLLSTSGFLILGSVILGERRIILTIIIAAIATGVVWYLVQVVLGIFLRPLPLFIGG